MGATLAGAAQTSDYRKAAGPGGVRLNAQPVPSELAAFRSKLARAHDVALRRFHPAVCRSAAVRILPMTTHQRTVSLRPRRIFQTHVVMICGDDF